LSVHVLDHELELRRQELQLEQDESALARRIRLELLQPEPAPARVIFPLRKLERAPHDEAAAMLLAWWRERPNKQGRVTNAQVEGLARKIRGLGRGRRT
jgi:hypothetical protein